MDDNTDVQILRRYTHIIVLYLHQLWNLEPFLYLGHEHVSGEVESQTDNCLNDVSTIKHMRALVVVSLLVYCIAIHCAPRFIT